MTAKNAETNVRYLEAILCAVVDKPTLIANHSCHHPARTMRGCENEKDFSPLPFYALASTIVAFKLQSTDDPILRSQPETKAETAHRVRT